MWKIPRHTQVVIGFDDVLRLQFNPPSPSRKPRPPNHKYSDDLPDRMETITAPTLSPSVPAPFGQVAAYPIVLSTRIRARFVLASFHQRSEAVALRLSCASKFTSNPYLMSCVRDGGDRRREVLRDKNPEWRRDTLLCLRG